MLIIESRPPSHSGASISASSLSYTFASSYFRVYRHGGLTSLFTYRFRTWYHVSARFLGLNSSESLERPSGSSSSRPFPSAWLFGSDLGPCCGCLGSTPEACSLDTASSVMQTFHSRHSYLRALSRVIALSTRAAPIAVGALLAMIGSLSCFSLFTDTEA